MKHEKYYRSEMPTFESTWWFLMIFEMLQRMFSTPRNIIVSSLTVLAVAASVWCLFFEWQGLLAGLALAGFVLACLVYLVTEPFGNFPG